MKKKMRRVWAMLLAMALVLQQGSTLGVLAVEDEPVSETSVENVAETQVSETAAETKAPETQAPEAQSEEKETKAEETKAPETQASETKVEETKAPETKAEETKVTESSDGAETEKATAPEETKPEETDAEESETAAGTDETTAEPDNTASSETATEQAAQSETMEEPAAGAAAEPETKPEPETAAQTEAGPTLLEAVCSNVKITVTAEPGTLEAGTVLNVRKVSEDPVKAAVAGTLEDDEWISAMLAFDISLERDGAEVQPKGKVQVAFDNVPFAADAKKAGDEIFVVHMPESTGGAATISALPGAAAGLEIEKGLKIETTHFSLYAVFQKHRGELEKKLEELEKSDTENQHAQEKQELQQAIDKFSEYGEPIPDKYEAKNSNQFTYTDENGEEQVFNSPAFDFHIFSEEADLGGVHTNGNVATNVFKGSTNFGTNQAKEDGVEEYNYVGQSADGYHPTDGLDNTKTVIGQSVGVTWDNQGGQLSLGTDGTNFGGKAAGNVYREGSEKFIDITEELNKLSKASKQLAKHGTSSGVTMDRKDQNDAKIIVEGKGNVFYLNVKATELAGIKWNIQIDPNATLVVNVNMYGADADTLRDFTAKVNGVGNDESRVRDTCNVLWNLYYKEEGGEVQSYRQEDGSYTKVAESGDFLGSILAPDANIQYGPVNGSVVARKTSHTGGESHNSRFTGFSVKLTVTKTLLDKTQTEPKTFYFAVYDEKGEKRIADQYVKSVTLKDRESGSVQFGGLKPGKYTVFETDAKGNKLTDSGYTITGNGQVVDFTGDSDETVSIVNSKEEEFGSLKITKNVTLNGEPTKLTKVDGTYKFQIKKDGTVVREVSITIRNGQSNTVSVDGLVPGEYVVSEVTGSNPEGVTLTGDNNIELTVSADQTENIPTAAFTNNKGEEEKKGSLTVKKTVAGNAGDQEKYFTFTVTLNDPTINGTFGDMTFVNGVATFKLKHGESKTAENLPEEIGYKVEESDNEGYKVTRKYGIGTISADTEKVAEFTNEKRIGGLKVEKTVSGDLGDKTKSFNFTVTLSDKEISGTYGDMTFENGVATFTLKHGESKTATGLPAGVTYEVEEKEANEDGYTTGTQGKPEGTIVEAVTSSVIFENAKSSLGELKVSKTVEGNAGDTEKEFHFKVELKDELGGEKVEGIYGDMTFKDGVAEFALKSGESAEATDLPVGLTYTVTEEEANKDGYTTDAEASTGTLEGGKAAHAVFTNTRNAKGKITLTKEGPDKEALQGAEFDLYRKTETGSEKVNAEKLKTDANGRITCEDLDPGTYYFVETLAPAGYILPHDEEAKTAECTVTKEGGLTQELTVSMVNQRKEEVTFGGRKFVEGVDSTDVVFTFELYEAADQTFDITGRAPMRKASTTGTITGSQAYEFHRIVYDSAHTHYYVVKEKAASEKDGFTYDETEYQITVELTKSAEGKLEKKVTVSGGATESTLDFTNKAASATISLDASKTMADPATALKTFEFELRDAADQVIATAQNDAAGKIGFSDFATYKLSDIGSTFTYKLKEKASQTPDGTIYDNAEYTVTVTVSADEATGAPKAEVTSIQKNGQAAAAAAFVNDVTHLSILKVDETGAALSGAKLLLKDAAGNVVDSWTTDGKAHDITGLAQGNYTLSEVEAPEGYQVSADVPVALTDANGSAAPLAVTMTDTKIPESDNRSLTVTKHLRLDGVTSDLAARNADYYVALFSDEARTQRISNVEKIEFRNASASSVTFRNLATGKTYYVGETDENGTLLVSKMINDRLIFYPEYGDNAKFTFEGEKLSADAEFTNVYVEIPNDFYLAGQLTITKKVLLNGEAFNTNDTFYARIFRDAALTQPEGGVLTLAPGGGSTASVTVTNLFIGETPGSSATYYVVETDANGVPLDPSKITEYEISVDKSEIVLSGNNSNQEVVITNNFFAEEESETEVVEEESETETETEVSSKKTAPKTGDDTDYMRYLLLMALSAGACATVLVQKRRKGRRTEK